MSAISRVIIVQQPNIRDAKGRMRFNFASAERFGKLEILAPNGKDILTPDVFRSLIKKQLADFNPDEDYLITTGDYSVLFFVGMIIAKQFGRARILRWVPSAKAYQPLLLDVRCP